MRKEYKNLVPCADKKDVMLQRVSISLKQVNERKKLLHSWSGLVDARISNRNSLKYV